jgi:lysozyme family protein
MPDQPYRTTTLPWYGTGLSGVVCFSLVWTLHTVNGSPTRDSSSRAPCGYGPGSPCPPFQVVGVQAEEPSLKMDYRG